MPVVGVDEDPIPVRRFDVIGKLNKNTRCVEHVGLSLEARTLGGQKSPLRVIDMAPPVAERDAGDSFPRHLVGTADLTSETDFEVVEMLENFVTSTRGKMEARSSGRVFPLPEEFRVYVIHPHSIEGYQDEDDEVHPARYSCAGYVYEGYRRAGLRLLDVGLLPNVTFNEVLIVDRRLALAQRKPELRKWVGLEGDGPWPIMMPGYLMASLNRRAEEIRQTPYTPQPEDMRFPPPAPTTSQAK
ncbi:MAG: hypothetical protein JJU11_13595 [Candidatus Sumerlaeia bacterium]|nr:hypothetical protein [Candidatus Sumerlaeia bacterium]